MLKKSLSKSIKNKLIASIAVLHAVLMSIFIVDLVNRQQAFLMDESLGYAKGIAQTLAANTVPWVLSNDVVGLDEIIHSQAKQPNFEFAMVTDPYGKILAYHHKNQPNPSITGQTIQEYDLLQEALTQPETTAFITNDEMRVDLAVPIKVQQTVIGWARISMSRKLINESIQFITLEGILYTIFAIIVGTFFAWRIGGNLTSGIYKLIDATQRVRAGERKIDLALNRHDELQTLSDNFQAMLNSLNRNESELLSEKERLQITLKSIGDGVITTDKEGRITYLNPVSEMLTGWTNSAAQGVHIEKVFRIYQESNMEPVENPALKSMKHRKVFSLANHTVLLNRAGEKISIEDSGAPIVDLSGEVLGSVLVFHDATEARMLRKRLTWQAMHDSLTGLKNRQAFENRLDELIEKNIQDPRLEHALIYIDLDQFKIVNDTVGHPAGDELLKQVSVIIEEQVRDSDLLARIGGDEFAILLENCSTENAEMVSEKVRAAIQKHRFLWEERIFDIGASIGITQMQGNINKADAMSQADVACYIAKQNGRNRIHIFKADDQSLSQEFSKLDWANRIKRALEDEQFVLFAQKITPLQTDNHKRAYEILVRLQTPNESIIGPDQFLPAAERFNLMGELDIYIIRKAVDWLTHHCDKIDLLNINISGQSLDNDSFNEALLDILEANPKTNRKICFEITESTAITRMSASIAFLNRVKSHGCQLALDDFGSGFSSFSWLKTIPVDYVKIDGAFVLDVLNDSIDAAMVRAIHQISDEMNIETIAEFVENQAVSDWLKEVGIDYAQGYHYHKPTPLEEII